MMPPNVYHHRYVHTYQPVEGWKLSAGWLDQASYTGSNETLILWPRKAIDIQIFKGVDMATMDAIRTQLRQLPGWYIESQVHDTIVWTFLGVYDEKLQS